MYPDDSLTLHTDLYQINMMQVYFDQGIHNKIAILPTWSRLAIMGHSWTISAISSWS